MPGTKSGSWGVWRRIQRHRPIAESRLASLIKRYGVKSLGQPRLQELELIKRYGEVAGVSSFATSIAGGGWWRLRFPQAAVMGAVLAGDPREMAPMGDPYRSVTPADIETMPEAWRRGLAAEQAEWLFKNTFTKRELVTRLDELVKEK